MCHAVITPLDSFSSYPAFSIAGKAIRPIRATTAPTMPVAVANSVQVTKAATAIEPGSARRPTCKLKKSLSRMLARSMMYPMKRNKGIDMSTSLFITLKVFCVNRYKMRLSHINWSGVK